MRCGEYSFVLCELVQLVESAAMLTYLSVDYDGLFFVGAQTKHKLQEQYHGFLITVHGLLLFGSLLGLLCVASKWIDGLQVVLFFQTLFVLVYLFLFGFSWATQENGLVIGICGSIWVVAWIGWISLRGLLGSEALEADGSVPPTGSASHPGNR